jgi:hypothetical protein
MDYIYNSESKSLDIKKEEVNNPDKREDIIKQTDSIRTEILPKFLSSDNLSFLLSNGCSYYAGSKAINNSTIGGNYKTKLSKFKFTDDKDKSQTPYKEKINDYEKLRPEEALDKLYQIQSHFENIAENIQAAKDIDQLIKDFKKSFLEEFILNIDYSKNHAHKQFLKKIVSRDSKLNKVNIFTLNYDLLIEKTAEKLGIYVNNGFLGFHDRHFQPASYQLDVHIGGSNVGKKYSKALNLFKLHGSISWYEDSGKPPYGISEKQLSENKEYKIDYGQIVNEAIIYPVQSKKKRSLDLPYSELFRQFVEALNKQRSALIVIGYSFLDEHVNDIITNALANPDFNLVVFSFDTFEDSISDYYKELCENSKEDNRITIFQGDVLGDFEFIVSYLMPYSEATNSENIIFKTFQELQKLKTSNDKSTV